MDITHLRLVPLYGTRRRRATGALHTAAPAAPSCRQNQAAGRHRLGGSGRGPAAAPAPAVSRAPAPVLSALPVTPPVIAPTRLPAALLPPASAGGPAPVARSGSAPRLLGRRPPRRAASLDGDALGHVLGGDDRGDLADQSGHGVVVGPDALDAGPDAGLPEQGPDVLLLLGQHEGDDDAGGAGPGGAPGAVQVGLVLGGRVDVDDELDAGDVDPPGGDVGGDHDVDLPGGEGPHGALARVLAHVALELDGGDPGLDELAGQAPGEVLGAGEQDALPLPGGQAPHDAVLGGLVRHHPHAVGHGVHGRGRGVHGVLQRVVEELLDQRVHAVVEGGGEQHALAALRGGAQDATDIGQEAEVGHVVGLVQDGDLDLVEADEPLPHEVQEPAGAGDDDVDPRLEGLLLGLGGDPAEDGGHIHVDHAGQGLDDLGDLEGELAGGGQDQADGVAGAGHVLLGEALDERQGEGEGLAGPGAPAAEHVAPGEGVGQGRGLDGERGGEAAGVQVGHEVGVDAERGEGRGHGGGRCGPGGGRDRLGAATGAGRSSARGGHGSPVVRDRAHVGRGAAGACASVR